MSLVKKPTMTEQKLAANQRNAPLSRGPVTPEGKQRSRAAHLRHGLNAKSQDWALQCLGEDPERFEELREGLCEEFPCATRFAAGVGKPPGAGAVADGPRRSLAGG